MKIFYKKLLTFNNFYVIINKKEVEILIKIRPEFKNEVLNHKKITYVADTIGASYTTTINILNNKVACRKMTALAILSVTKDLPISSPELQEMYKKYFKEVEDDERM